MTGSGWTQPEWGCQRFARSLSGRAGGRGRKGLDGRKFICGQLSIADFMTCLWIAPRKNQGIIL